MYHSYQELNINNRVVYRSQSIRQEEDVRLQHAIMEVSKGECATMDILTMVIYN